MFLRRYAGGSEVPAGLFLEGWLSHSICVRRGGGPLPGPAERRFLRLSPLVALLAAPFLGTFFVLGFLVLTPVAVLTIPFAALRRRRQNRSGITAAGLLGAATLLGFSWANAQGIANERCLMCHRNPLAMRLADGSKVSLQVSAEALVKSVHGRTLLCTACHRDIEKIPHRKRAFADRRALILRYSQACTTCHGGKFEEFQEGVHWRLLSQGDRRAPLCADCHGAHAVSKRDLVRDQVSSACAKCHGGISRSYEKSAHGLALTGEGNPDVPTCSTCHRSHTTQDPRKVDFRMDIPNLCADCHQNEPLMKKYGISAQVVSTYLEDFHGVSVDLYRRQEASPARLTAVCTDCHGIHDIRSVRDPESRVVRENLLRTCQECHPGASPNFPSAWLSHFIPSPRRAALVYFVNLFYLIFLPGVGGGLVLHVGLDLFHGLKARRAARSREEG